MFMSEKGLAVAISSVLFSFAAHAVQDARSIAMGGTGVASGSYQSAAFYNPALLTKSKANDNFSLILPSIAGEAADPSDLIDNLDEFQLAFDDFEGQLRAIEHLIDQGSADFDPALAPGLIASLDDSRTNLANAFGALDGMVNGGVTVGTAITIPTRSYSVGIYAKANVEFGVELNIAQSDVDIINNATTVDELNSLQSDVQTFAAGIQEFGVAIAREFDINGSKVSIGITPKFQKVETFDYTASAQSFDEDDFDADQYRVSDSNFNLDIGASVKLDHNWTVGLVAKDLISNDYQTMTAGIVYQIKPMITTGIAYNNDWATAALDIDLTSKDRFGMGNDTTQFIRAGVELNGWDWAKLRFGYRHDTKDNVQDMVTAGVGLSAFGAVHLDLTAMYADENELGAGIELSFTF